MKSQHVEGTAAKPTVFVLPRYDNLPAFGVYVDQLISYVNDIVDFSYMPEEKPLTATMVNNYVKQGAVPKPEKKKYTRNHIACLIIICLLKKVFSIREITELIQIQIEAYPTELAYDSFISSLEVSLAEVFTGAGSNTPADRDDELNQETVLVESAVTTFCNKLFVQKGIIEKARTHNTPGRSTKAAKKERPAR